MTAKNIALGDRQVHDIGMPPNPFQQDEILLTVLGDGKIAQMHSPVSTLFHREIFTDEAKLANCLKAFAQANKGLWLCGLIDYEITHYRSKLAKKTQETAPFFEPQLRLAAFAPEQIEFLKPSQLIRMPHAQKNLAALNFTPRIQDQAALEAIEKSIAYIHAGDVYQVNWSLPFLAAAEDPDLPLALFLSSFVHNPTPFATYWKMPGRFLVSNSPELLLNAAPNPSGKIQLNTRPIKGTIGRHMDPKKDADACEELLKSEKDQAENLMIVDLLRNDLSKVCASGSVKVPKLFQLESVRNVHHLVSTVTGEVAADHALWDAVSALFPGGSITGAPKIRAMELIDELETGSRGAYCGSFFTFSPDQILRASLLIRSVDIRQQGQSWRYLLRSGAGIVADSKPQKELQEIYTKAKIFTQITETENIRAMPQFWS